MFIIDYMGVYCINTILCTFAYVWNFPWKVALNGKERRIRRRKRRGFHLPNQRNLRLSPKREVQAPPHMQHKPFPLSQKSQCLPGRRTHDWWPRQWFRNHGSELDNPFRAAGWAGLVEGQLGAQAERTEEWDQLWAWSLFSLAMAFKGNKSYFLRQYNPT